LEVVASVRKILAVPNEISKAFLGSAGRNALVAADPFQPSSPLFFSKSSGGTKGPFAAEATVIEAGRPLDTEETAKGKGLIS
jgi:hypothetical protein